MSGTVGGPRDRSARDPDEHQQLRVLLGVHALGHLAPEEDAAVRAHLDGCAACRAELAEIAPLRRALEGIDPERLHSPATPPPWLGQQVRRTVAAERAAREPAGGRGEVSRPAPGRRVGFAVAAAAVLVLVVGAGVLLGRSTAPEPPAVPFEAVQLEEVGDEDVQVVEAGLVPHTWGVELRVRASGFEEGAVYRASFVDQRGRATPAGEFLGTGEDEMLCNLQAALLRTSAVRVVISDASGDPVLSADI